MKQILYLLGFIAICKCIGERQFNSEQTQDQKDELIDKLLGSYRFLEKSYQNHRKQKFDLKEIQNKFQQFKIQKIDQNQTEVIAKQNQTNDMIQQQIADNLLSLSNQFIGNHVQNLQQQDENNNSNAYINDLKGIINKLNTFVQQFSIMKQIFTNNLNVIDPSQKEIQKKYFEIIENYQQEQTSSDMLKQKLQDIFFNSQIQQQLNITITKNQNQLANNKSQESQVQQKDNKDKQVTKEIKNNEEQNKTQNPLKITKENDIQNKTNQQKNNVNQSQIVNNIISQNKEQFGEFEDLQKNENLFDNKNNLLDDFFNQNQNKDLNLVFQNFLQLKSKYNKKLNIKKKLKINK